MEILKIRTLDKKRIVPEIQKGSIFIYPTDTLYGIGCNALKKESVEKIRTLKNTDHPFSVIAPSKKWIHENLRLKHTEFLEKLPGPYTLIFEKKKKDFLKECSETGKLGIRIPDHIFTALIQKSGVPFVTTSANVSGHPPIKKISELPLAFKENIDFAIDGGPATNQPSTIFDLTGETPKKIR